MARWVAIIPAGDEVQIVHAHIDAPQLLDPAEVEGWARYESAAKTMRELGLEPPPWRNGPTLSEVFRPPAPRIGEMPANVVPIANRNGDVYEPPPEDPTDRVYQSTDIEILACRCASVYGLNGDPDHDRAIRAAFKAHQRTCEVAIQHKGLDGNAEDGGFVWAAAKGPVAGA